MHTATRMDGKVLSLRIQDDLKARIAAHGLRPKLIIFQVGHHEASNIYIQRKKLYGASIGADVEHQLYEDSTPVSEIQKSIVEANADTRVHGIIIQLPLPVQWNASELISCIDPCKDVDCLTAQNSKLLFDEQPRYIPATTKGIVSLLKAYEISIEGKRVTVIGRSALVGKPTALVFMQHDATVTVCHTKTQSLNEETRRAHIIISATGQAGLITKEHVCEGQVIVDVGISAVTNHGIRTIKGDVRFDEVASIVSHITPVPGGVGPMTIASLFENVVQSAEAASM